MWGNVSVKFWILNYAFFGNGYHSPGIRRGISLRRFGALECTLVAHNLVSSRLVSPIGETRRDETTRDCEQDARLWARRKMVSMRDEIVSMRDEIVSMRDKIVSWISRCQRERRDCEHKKRDCEHETRLWASDASLWAIIMLLLTISRLMLTISSRHLARRDETKRDETRLWAQASTGKL